MSPEIVIDRLQERLQTKRFGRRTFFSREATSTNDWGKELARLGVEEGTVVVAETQTSGHGRLGRQWVSPKGGLWFSVVLRPELSPSEAVGLVFMAGLSVAEVLHRKYGLKVETKWPNDVLVNGKKICGVLVEMSTIGTKVSFVIVGVGINANFDVEQSFSEPLLAGATSLKEELGRKVRLERLLGDLLEELENAYDQSVNGISSATMEKWKSYAGFIGRKVKVTTEDGKISGLALDVNREGALILKLTNGRTRHFFVGDISMKT
jgi:BirA family biotin operon repressor/biotin-[acetyl-CoA-carboxylase] ligase